MSRFHRAHSLYNPAKSLTTGGLASWLLQPQKRIILLVAFLILYVYVWSFLSGEHSEELASKVIFETDAGALPAHNISKAGAISESADNATRPPVDLSTIDHHLKVSDKFGTGKGYADQPAMEKIKAVR
jgi:hypothetical protein